MIRIMLICHSLLLCASITFGQITGNPFSKDPRAHAITKEYQALLCGKSWICINKSETRRGTKTDQPQPLNSPIKFGCDGQFNNNGTWTVVNEQFIKIKTTEPHLHWLQDGNYSIYHLNDSSLVLARVLTSTGDWTKEYTFTTNPPSTSIESKSYLRSDSVKSGTQTTYYPDKRIKSIETHALIKRKVSKEELFLNNFNMFGNRFDPLDSSIQEAVPQGEWTYYHTNGTISAKKYFDKTGKRTGKWLFFDADGRLTRTETYGEPDRYEYFDQYEYSNNATLPVVIRNSFEQSQRFIIGSKDSLEFGSVAFHIIQPANSYSVQAIQIKNLSNHNVQVNITKSIRFDFQPIHLAMDPGDSTTLNLAIRIPEGPGADVIHIESSEWQLNVPVKYLGYHLSNQDFSSTSTKKLPRKVLFYRLSDEHELNIKGVGKEVTVPLSKQINEINLKRGKYRLTLVGKTTKSIDVEVQ